VVREGDHLPFRERMLRLLKTTRIENYLGIEKFLLVIPETFAIPHEVPELDQKRTLMLLVALEAVSAMDTEAILDTEAIIEAEDAVAVVDGLARTTGAMKVEIEICESETIEIETEI
jgi:hypothetical protein